MRYLYTLLLVATLGITCAAQDIATHTIRWSSDRAFDTSQGEAIEEATTLISYADRLEWRNADGTVRKVYTVISVVQGWDNVSLPGKARYRITAEGFGGVAVFERTTAGIRITLTVAKEAPESFEILVSNYQAL
ncbi:hypothetical protein [Parachryseolinea silvisoli]|uniref:hypothetical protein n=1 Tax=Parachryseolinea silvisoli TaxID=2873601 RepID=UPI00226597A4|nr:hypothetical protein [Parachryseolinea silvisoli]MCD9017902.1 hypothetical protein [Parachryseolinea silvisoli]